MKLASGAFQHVEMSVGLGDTFVELTQDPKSMLDNYEGFSLVSFAAQVARDEKQRVCRDEKPDDPAHGLVVGKKTGACQRSLARACAWEVAPENACEPPAE